MSKVVYLLGAGASYGKRIEPDELTMDDVSLIEEGLPVVNEINNELQFVNGWIGNVDLKDKNYVFEGKRCGVEELREELINGFDWMQEQSSRHATIDTFAKKLYLKGANNDYGRLKYLLSTFFLIEQTLHPYDKRYDTFLASILNKDMDIPNDLFVMTWNYDLQLDIAYRDYKEWGLPMHLPSETTNLNKTARVFKINGSANYYGLNSIDSNVFMKDDYSLLMDKIFEHLCYTTSRGGYSSGTTDLFFAWEKDTYDQLSGILYDNISDAEVLVIIGYTFPFFNREIDREIYTKMPHLKTIYIQDPNADMVKSSLKSILPKNTSDKLFDSIGMIYQTSNFFLPPEL